MIGVLFASLAAGLTTIVFLIGFASVRLRGQRDRALSRADSIATALAQRTADGKVTTDRDVERTAEAYLDAVRLDPMSKLTVIVTWLVFILMVILCLIELGHSGSALSLEPLRWSFDTWAGLFVLLVAFSVSTVGTREYVWVRNDLSARLTTSPIGQVRTAIMQRRNGMIEESLATMNRLLAEFDVWPWAFAFRSQLHASRDELDAAITDLDKALRLEPDDAWHRIARAELLMRKSEPQLALDDLEHVGTRLPSEPQVLRLHGSALLAVGRRDESLQVLARALTAQPGDVTTRFERGRALADLRSLEHDTTPLIALREIVLDEGQRIAVETISNTARDHLVEDDLRTAVEDFTIVIDHDPNNARALAMRGFARARLGLPDLSEEDFGRALLLGDEQEFVLREMAYARRAVGNNEEAEELFTRAINIRATSVNHFQRAMTRSDLGKLELSVDDFRAALLLRPGWPEAMTHLGVSLGRLGRFDESDAQFREVERAAPDDAHNAEFWAKVLIFEQDLPHDAIAVLDRALSNSPGSGRLHELRGTIQARLKRFASAQADFDTAEALGVDPSLLALDRASAYIDAHQQADAIEALSRAVDVPSEHRFGILANRATLLRDAGSLTEALRDLDTSIELKPDVPEVLVSRACLLTSMGEYERADTDLEAAIRLEPSSVSAYWHRAELRSTRGQLEEALEDVAQMQELGAKEHVVSALRGSIEFSRRDWQSAATHYQQALRAAPPERHADYISSLAAAFDNAGLFEDAEALFRRLADDEPGAFANLRLGICLAQQHKDTECLELFVSVRETLEEGAEEMFRANIRPDFLLEGEHVVRMWENSAVASSSRLPSEDSPQATNSALAPDDATSSGQ